MCDFYLTADYEPGLKCFISELADAALRLKSWETEANESLLIIFVSHTICFFSRIKEVKNQMKGLWQSYVRWL